MPETDNNPTTDLLSTASGRSGGNGMPSPTAPAQSPPASSTPQNASPSPDASAQTTPAMEVEWKPPEADDVHDDEPDEIKQLWFYIQFRDGLDQPIQGLETEVTIPDSPPQTATTDDKGLIFVQKPADSQGTASVSVHDLHGKKQQVAKLDLAKCQHGARVRSHKTLVKHPTRPHHPQDAVAQSKPDAPAKPVPTTGHTGTTPWYEAKAQAAWQWLKDHLHPSHTATPAAATGNGPHQRADAQTPSGNPQTVAVGPETGGEENLLLGNNNIYRDAIVSAAKRTKLLPQALAALINAEAATVQDYETVLGPDGKPVLIKKGKQAGQPLKRLVGHHWNANSAASTSSAAGLTQFLKGSWLSEVLIKGTYLNQESIKLGWVMTDKAKQVFVLSDGSRTATPWSKKHLSDANVVACLDKRNDPLWSVNAAADYGLANLKVLKNKGMKLDGLTDGEKAKLMYVMHHEGAGRGVWFIQNTMLQNMKASVLEGILHAQLGGGKKGKAMLDSLLENAHGDVEAAYRRWLADYIDKKVDINYFSMKKGSDVAKALSICSRVI